MSALTKCNKSAKQAKDPSAEKDVASHSTHPEAHSQSRDIYEANPSPEGQESSAKPTHDPMVKNFEITQTANFG